MIAVTNPLDAMVTQLKRVTGLPKNMIVGQAGVLDSARYRTFLAMELRVSVAEHRGDGARRPRRRHGAGAQLLRARAACRSRSTSMRERLEEIEKRTRNGGAEIVNLMKTSSTTAAGTPRSQMVEAYILDRKQVLPCAAYLDGEYGVKGFFAGVPVVIGAGGVERVIEIALTDAEKKALRQSRSPCARAGRCDGQSSGGLTMMALSLSCLPQGEISVRGAGCATLATAG